MSAKIISFESYRFWVEETRREWFADLSDVEFDNFLNRGIVSPSAAQDCRVFRLALNAEVRERRLPPAVSPEVRNLEVR